jgi:hypothetical protein
MIFFSINKFVEGELFHYIVFPCLHDENKTHSLTETPKENEVRDAGHVF